MNHINKKMTVNATDESAKPNAHGKDFVIGEFYDKNTHEYITLRFRTFGEAQSFERLNRDVLRWIDFYESPDDTSVVPGGECLKDTY